MILLYDHDAVHDYTRQCKLSGLTKLTTTCKLKTTSKNSSIFVVPSAARP